MKNIIQTLILTIGCWLLSITYSYSQTQDWLWAKSAGGSGDDRGNCICTDAKGNVYVTGSFNSDSIIFGSYTLKNVGFNDIFLAKYDALGNILWAKSAGGIYDDYGYNLSTDANANVYVIGWFDGPTITFGNYTLTNVGGEDIFLVKYDLSGNVLWAVSAGGKIDEESTCLGIDASGNIYVTGYFMSDTITFGNYTLTNVNNWNRNSDMFLAKYDALGNVLWAKSAGGSSDDDGLSVSTDANANVYVTGKFKSDTITFGNYTLTNARYSDMFIAKYDALGNILWAKSTGSSDMDDNWGNSVCTDANANVYVTGMFGSPTITFGNYTLTNAKKYFFDMFIAKYDALGNVLWAKSAGGNDNDFVYNISTDANANVYVTGIYQSPTITFENYTLTNAGYYDIFIAKYDALGNVLWAKSTGGNGDDRGISISTDTNANVYVTGWFGSPTISFGNYTLTNAGNSWSDMFLAKLGVNDTTGINQFTIQNSSFTIYPNPAKDIVYVNHSYPAEVNIFNLTGQQVMQAKLTTEKSINISSLNAGIYILQATEDNKIYNCKLIVNQ